VSLVKMNLYMVWLKSLSQHNILTGKIWICIYLLHIPVVLFDIVVVVPAGFNHIVRTTARPIVVTNIPIVRPAKHALQVGEKAPQHLLHKVYEIIFKKKSYYYRCEAGKHRWISRGSTHNCPTLIELIFSS
jgi:hypothetical protein